MADVSFLLSFFIYLFFLFYLLVMSQPDKENLDPAKAVKDLVRMSPRSVLKD